MATVTIDNFRNTVINYPESVTVTVDQLKEDVTNNPNENNLAVIIVGVEKAIAEQYNEEKGYTTHDKRKIYYQVVVVGEVVMEETDMTIRIRLLTVSKKKM